MAEVAIGVADGEPTALDLMAGKTLDIHQVGRRRPEVPFLDGDHAKRQWVDDLVAIGRRPTRYRESWGRTGVARLLRRVEEAAIVTQHARLEETEGPAFEAAGYCSISTKMPTSL